MSLENATHKVVFVGEAYVGKTAIIRKFKTSNFEEDTESTIGAANCILPVELDENNTVPLDVWDTAGQERYKSLTPIYFQNAEVIVFVFDLTQKQTLGVIESHLDMISQKAPSNCGILFVGNKDDIVDARAISASDIDACRERCHGFEAIETSAKTGHNIDEVFISVAKFVSKKAKVITESRPDQVNINNPQNEKSEKNGCCM